MRNYVDGTFCKDDRNMLFGVLFKGKFLKINNDINSIAIWSNI
jgi:hypothetical protein